MIHGAKDGAAEPLLPVHARGHSLSLPTSPSELPPAHKPSDTPERTREKYLKQLGYTPLIFKARQRARGALYATSRR